MYVIMSSVIISFKNMSVTKLLKSQDETISPYDKNLYPGYTEHYEQIAYIRNFHL